MESDRPELRAKTGYRIRFPGYAPLCPVHGCYTTPQSYKGGCIYYECPVHGCNEHPKREQNTQTSD